MNRKLALSLGGIAALAVGAASFPASVASAAPTYCVARAWDYADSMTGGDRQDPDWTAYNTAFQDYNHCYQPNACNDIDIPCVNPPM